MLRSNSEGSLVLEVNIQARVRWGQAFPGLFVVNKQQIGQTYILKGLFGETAKDGLTAVRARGEGRWPEARQW